MTPAQFIELIRRSNLIDEDGLGRIAIRRATAIQLATDMVDAGLLTRWQADKLLAGKFKGFNFAGFTLLRHLRKCETGQEYAAEHGVTKRKVVLLVRPPSLGSPVEPFGNQWQEENGVYYVVKPFIEGLNED